MLSVLQLTSSDCHFSIFQLFALIFYISLSQLKKYVLHLRFEEGPSRNLFVRQRLLTLSFTQALNQKTSHNHHYLLQEERILCHLSVILELLSLSARLEMVPPFRFYLFQVHIACDLVQINLYEIKYARITSIAFN